MHNLIDKAIQFHRALLKHGMRTTLEISLADQVGQWLATQDIEGYDQILTRQGAIGAIRYHRQLAVEYHYQNDAERGEIAEAWAKDVQDRWRIEEDEIRDQFYRDKERGQRAVYQRQG